MFVLTLDAAPADPLLATVARGRQFRADDDTDVLLEHLAAAAAADVGADGGGLPDERQLLL